MNDTFFLNLGKEEADPMSTEGTSTAFQLNGVRAELFVSHDGGVAIHKVTKRSQMSVKPIATGRIYHNPHKGNKKPADYIIRAETTKGSVFEYWAWDHGRFFTFAPKSAQIRKGLKPQIAEYPSN